MENEVRQEFDKLHERVTRLRERVVNLEAQQPHVRETMERLEKNMNDGIARVEGSVEKLTNKISKSVWVVATPLIGSLVIIALKLLISLDPKIFP